MWRMTRYHKSRFWALWDDNGLVAVVVYKKGAAELLRRLAAQPPAANGSAPGSHRLVVPPPSLPVLARGHTRPTRGTYADHLGCTTRGRCEPRASEPQAAVSFWRPVPTGP